MTENELNQRKNKMANKLKTAEQFLKDHEKWLKLFENDKVTLGERPKGKKYELSGVNLEGAKLNHANLRDANLSYADLTNANLFGADLTNADLTNADLTNAKFRHAILNEATLKNVIMKDTDFTRADFISADLRDVNLEPLFGTGYLYDIDLKNAKVDRKYKENLNRELVHRYGTVQWIADAIIPDEKLNTYMKLVDHLKIQGFSNSDILKIIDSLELINK